MRITTDFSEIIKFQVGKKFHTLLCILKLFRNVVDQLSLKMRGYPQFSFRISVTLAKVFFSA